MRNYSGWEIAALVLVPLAVFAALMTALAYGVRKSNDELREGYRRGMYWRLGTLALIGLILLLRFIASLFS